ncbi:deoxyribose-phosphate aldolase [Cylas formicarius]|uniref:deoxyribose-phosphate aldolase n=1 Tax=Cylas formicarius TaxID=197179 RepID=UPI0029589EE8|nr:deoxyribose-phosphate aldolase [Cylas formicarius]
MKVLETHNPGYDLDLGWLNSVNINLTSINKLAKELPFSKELKDKYRAAWILKAITLIDLTTLAGDDTFSNVSRLCVKAAKPVAEDLLSELGYEYNKDCPIHTAAVCVYPSRVPDAVSSLKRLGFYEKINVASVATGFPCGQTPLKTRLDEIRYAVDQGANEIDIVIDRSLVLTGRWEDLYQEIKQMKEACGEAHMKTILATGELGTLNNVYKTSMVAMMAGADFIKTSTGKETVNATLQVGIVMCRAIKDYYNKYGYKVGFKPAGGVRNTKDALAWLVLIKELLGTEWLTPDLFRFGASGLLGDLELNLYQFITKKYPVAYEFSMG